MRTKLLFRQNGFTIVELLLYMGIFSILLIVLLQLFTNILSLHRESQATSSVDQDGAAILARFTYDVHSASSVTSPSIGNFCTWPTTSTCKLILGNGTTYSVDTNGNLLLAVTGNTTEQLNSINTKVTSITFTTLGNTVVGAKPSVQMNMTLQSLTKRAENITQEQSFQITGGTR